MIYLTSYEHTGTANIWISNDVVNQTENNNTHNNVDIIDASTPDLEQSVNHIIQIVPTINNITQNYNKDNLYLYVNIIPSTPTRVENEFKINGLMRTI